MIVFWASKESTMVHFGNLFTSKCQARNFKINKVIQFEVSNRCVLLWKPIGGQQNECICLLGDKLQIALLVSRR